MAIEDTLKQFNKSGFPFQLKVENAVRATEQIHHWSVANREHPWATEAKSGFIDLVLKHNQFSTFRMVVECKRLKADDARQLQWLFLIPDLTSPQAAKASCLEVESNINALIWDDVRVWPTSYESEFCILQGDDPKRQPLLETLAKDLLEQTEGLAQEEISVQKSIELGHRPSSPFSIPP